MTGARVRLVARCALLVPALAMTLVLGAIGLGSAALALEPVRLTGNEDRIELTPLGQVHAPQGDKLQVEAAGADGLQARMTVPAVTPGSSPRWLVFSLTNTTAGPLERLLTSERYALVGSGVIWPDLDTRRLEAVTPSRGFLPERVRNDRADIFRLTLEAGQTITYAVELATDRVPRIHLWQPVPYELKARDRQLFNGILLGIVGVLGIFLTSVFAANHKGIFPAAALVAWTLLAYLCVDFGFFHKLFNLRAEDNAVYRAATESAVAASLVIFLTTFLRAHAWQSFAQMLALLWIIGQLALVAVAVVDPRLAATFARASFLAIGGIGSLLILYFFIRGQDRALALIPTWILFLVFIYGAYVAISGRLGGEIVVSSFAASLVLLAVLIGFTVTQFAFRAGDVSFLARPGAGEGGLGQLAIELSRAAIWEWRAASGEIKVGPAVEHRLGLVAGELSGKVETFVRHLHPADRDKILLQLWSTQDRGRGAIAVDMRMRHADNSYVWFALEASSLEQDDGREVHCIGLMRDITDHKSQQERLIHDAVNDSRTGLPNRALLLDRIHVALRSPPVEQGYRAVVIVLGLDRLGEHNARFGRVVGDTLLQTTARRITLAIRPEDTLARIGGDQFGLLIRSQSEPRAVELLAERIRTAIQQPTSVVGEEVVLTGSIGIAFADDTNPDAASLLGNAEIAMARAKRDGANRSEIFTDDLVTQPDTRGATAAELAIAIEREQLLVTYQPIVYLATEELVGFEALVRWQHPKLGLLMPDDFIPLAEANDLTPRLGHYVLARAAEDAARWRQQFPRADKPLFLAVNVSSQQLFRDGLIADVRRTIARHSFDPGVLRLEITETMVMDNPEQAAEVLSHLKAAGASLAMDDFGTGYSSLAYLQRFPFDVIKIDRALVQSCGTDAAGSAIVRSIVALAHELGRKVVAEGIEDAQDAAFLRSIGCDFGQGFHFGEATPLKETLAYLKFVQKTERQLGKRGIKGAAPARVIDEATSTKTLSGVLAKARQKPGKSATARAPAGTTASRTPSAAAGLPLPREKDAQVPQSVVPQALAPQSPTPTQITQGLPALPTFAAEPRPPQPEERPDPTPPWQMPMALQESQGLPAPPSFAAEPLPPPPEERPDPTPPWQMPPALQESQRLPAPPSFAAEPLPPPPEERPDLTPPWQMPTVPPAPAAGFTTVTLASLPAPEPAASATLTQSMAAALSHPAETVVPQSTPAPPPWNNLQAAPPAFALPPPGAPSLTETMAAALTPARALSASLLPEFVPQPPSPGPEIDTASHNRRLADALAAPVLAGPGPAIEPPSSLPPPPSLTPPLSSLPFDNLPPLTSMSGVEQTPPLGPPLLPKSGSVTTLPFDTLPPLQPMRAPVTAPPPRPTSIAENRGRTPLPSAVRQLRPIPRPRTPSKGLPPRIAQSLARLAGEQGAADAGPPDTTAPPSAAE